MEHYFRWPWHFSICAGFDNSRPHFSTNKMPHSKSYTKVIILNPGSLSSEDFLLWACLIEEGS